MTRKISGALLAGLVFAQIGYGQGAASQTPASVQGATVAPKQQRPNRQIRKQAARQNEDKPAATTSPARNASGRAGTGKSNRQLRGPQITFSDALRRCRHDSHHSMWWRQHYTTIVFVSGGYFYYDAGYWFPAWGYDPQYDFHEYDGPIYTYGDLLPDQVILNVQRALKELGYYAGALNGSLDQPTRAAIGTYQEDAGLDVTGAIDEPTVQALGLY